MIADVEAKVETLEKTVQVANQEVQKSVGKDTPQAYKKMATEAKKSLKEVEDATKQVDKAAKDSAGGGGVSFMTKKFSALGMSLRGGGATAAAIATPLLGIGGGVGTAMKGVSQAADAEGMELAFKTLVGDGPKAERVLASIQKFAADTPFEMPELMAASKQMIAYGQDAASVVPTMRMLGDVASGLQLNLGDLTMVYGTLKSQGRAFTQDINQFALRGIPIWQQLESQLGKSNAQVRAMVEGGQIKFEDVEKAFKATTGPMSKFQGGMEAQSKTLNGLYSTMKDNMNQVVTTIGKQIISMLGLKNIVDEIGSAAQNLGNWLKALPAPIAGMIIGLTTIVALSTALAILWPFIGTTVMGILAGIKVALLTLLNPFTVIGVAVVGVKLMILALMNPITWVMLALTAFAALFILKAGGIKEAWEQLKAAAVAAWDWLEPIRRNLMMFFTNVQTAIQQGLEVLKKEVKQVWEDIAGQAEINWGEVRDHILTALMFAEFTLFNFSQAATAMWELIKIGSDVAWAGIKYGAVALVNALLRNVFLIFLLGITGPAGMLVLIGFAFQDTFSEILRFIKDTFINAIKMAAEFHAKLILAVSRGVMPTFAELFGDFKVGDIKVDMRGIKVEGLEVLEAKLRKEFDTAVNAAKEKGGEVMAPFLEDFEEFKKKRLAELAIPEAVKQQITDPVVGDLKKMADAAKHETSKFDAALMGSAESITRFQDYKDRVTVNNEKYGGEWQGGLGMGRGGRPLVNNFGAMPIANGAGTMIRGGEIIQRNAVDNAPGIGRGEGWVEAAPILREIRDALKPDPAKPKVELEISKFFD